MEEADSLYLHYWTVHATEEVSAMQAWSNGKDRILKEHLSRAYDNNKQIYRDFSKLKTANPKFAYEVVTGKAFEQAFMAGSQTVPSVSNIDVGKDIDQILANAGKTSANLNKIDSELGQLVDECLDIMNRYIENKGILQSEVDKVVAQAISSVKNTSNDEIEEEIVRKLMNETARKAFVYKGYDSNKKVRGDLSQLMVAIYALKEPSTYSSISGVEAPRKHGKSKESTTQEMVSAIKELLKKWKDNLAAVMHESTVAVGVGTGVVELNKGLTLLDSKMTGTGTSSHGVEQVRQRLERDPRLNKLVNSSQKARQAALRKRVNKSDASIGWVDENKMEAHMNFTVKKAESMQLDVNGNIEYVNFYAVNNSPLSNLLLRDLEFGYSDFHNFIQISIAHGNDAKMDSLFNQTIEMVKTKALYSVIVGELKEKGNIMLNIGNKFIPLSKVFSNLLRGGGSSSLTETSMSKANGLVRRTYVALNRWQGKDGPNKDKALERSEKVEKDAFNLIYSTKIKISITLRNLKL